MTSMSVQLGSLLALVHDRTPEDLRLLDGQYVVVGNCDLMWWVALNIALSVGEHTELILLSDGDLAEKLAASLQALRPHMYVYGAPDIRTGLVMLPHTPLFEDVPASPFVVVLCTHPRTWPELVRLVLKIYCAVRFWYPLLLCVYCVSDNIYVVAADTAAISPRQILRKISKVAKEVSCGDQGTTLAQVVAASLATRLLAHVERERSRRVLVIRTSVSELAQCITR